MLHEEDSIDSPLSIHLHPTELLSSEERYYYESLSDDDQYLYNQSRIKRYYYHRDHQNSIIALSDHNAQIVEYYEYDIYGNITKADVIQDDEGKTIQTLNPYRYTGREYETPDLYYYRARYYDPTIGRFITPDPIGFLGGDTNFYRYVGNDPINRIDPTGLSKCDTQEKKNKQASEKLKNKQSFKWKKVLKSGAKKVGGSALFFIDGPIPIGDIFGAALLASDFADGVQAAQEIADASSELKSAAADLQKCQKQQQTQQTASKEKSGFKVGGEGEPPKNNNKKKKENLKCGEGGSYKDLKKKAAATVDMERDHAPSSAALLERARQLNAGEELTSAQKSAVSNAGHTLAIPKEIHASHSLTYKGRNTPTQISKDANNLAGAAKRDLAAIKKGLKPECKKEYEQYAKKIRKLSNAEYDAILKKAIGIE